MCLSLSWKKSHDSAVYGKRLQEILSHGAWSPFLAMALASLTSDTFGSFI